VRTPTVQDHDLRVRFLPQPPLSPVMIGNRGFEAEDLLAYEAGIRGQPTDRFSWDMAVFLHQYHDLAGLLPGAPSGFWPSPVLGPLVEIPLLKTNLVDGQTYGFELTANYSIHENWKIYGAYTFFQMWLNEPPDVQSIAADGQDPCNQLYIQSSWNLGCQWQCDLVWRYVDYLPAMGVASYNAMDVRLAWRPRTDLELAVVGRHLLDEEHLEFGADQFTGNVSTEVQSEMYGMITWEY
jgi:iron complex outermembrane receptor protein